MPPLTDGSSPNGEAPVPEEPVSGSPEAGSTEAPSTEAGPTETGCSGTGATEIGSTRDGSAETGSTTDGNGQPAEEDFEQPRRHPSTIGGAIYLTVLATTLAGLVIVTTGRWRTGVHWMAGALIAAAIARAVLPRRDAGMLAVRNRWFDAGLLAGIGVVLWVLATSIPAAS